MKKRFINLLILTFVLVFFASCGGQTGEKDVKENQSENQGEENSVEEKEQSESSKENSNVLKVGMELKWPPFEMTDTDGKPDGISVLIANELGNFLGRKVEIVDLSFGSMITALETEKIDIIISSMSITEERKQKINFSNPYMYFKLLAAVNKESGLKTRDDVFKKESLRFVAPKGFSSLELARKNANNPQILEFDDKGTATLELSNGNADVFVVDAVTAVGISKKYPDNVEVIYEPIEVSPIGMGIRKNDTELLEKVNEFVGKMEDIGVNKKIKEQYDDTLQELVGKTYEFYIDEN